MIFSFLVLFVTIAHGQVRDLYGLEFYHIYHPKQFQYNNQTVNVINSNGHYQGLHYFISERQFNDSLFTTIKDSMNYLYCNFKDGVADSIWTVVEEDGTIAIGKLSFRNELVFIPDSLFNDKYNDGKQKFPLSRNGLWSYYNNNKELMYKERYDDYYIGKNRHITHTLMDLVGNERVIYHIIRRRNIFFFSKRRRITHKETEYYQNGEIYQFKYRGFFKSVYEVYYPNGNLEMKIRNRPQLLRRSNRAVKKVFNEDGKRTCKAIGICNEDGFFQFSQESNCYMVQ
jgi:hypothetical protein